MYLTKHRTPDGPRWALDQGLLPPDFTLDRALELPRKDLDAFLRSLPRSESSADDLARLAPVEALTEIWAAGVTYLRSREAREAESTVKDVYAKVYDAERPELFWKSIGWRAKGDGQPIRVRRDSRWNVPEPELVVVVNAHREIVGFTVGNDVSSRDIEGENPLYLPQAKVYNGSCAVGPGILLSNAEELASLPVQIEIWRGGMPVFHGETNTSQLKRPLSELVSYLARELDFPRGVLLMTGTGIIPPPEFSLDPGDRVRITVGSLTLENECR